MDLSTKLCLGPQACGFLVARMISCGLDELARGAFGAFGSFSFVLQEWGGGEEQEEVWGQILLFFPLLKSPLETRKILT